MLFLVFCFKKFKNLAWVFEATFFYTELTTLFSSKGEYNEKGH
jgi:hypothetical protein